MMKYGAEPGHMIRRQFHDERSRLAPEKGILEDETRNHRENYPGQVNAHDDETGHPAEKGNTKKSIYRKTGPAGHERSHEHGYVPIPFVFKRPGSHDGRYGTAKPHDHGNKGLSRQTDRPERPVHHERGAGHIPGVFQKREREEHGKHDGNKGCNRLNTRADSPCEKAYEPLGRSGGFQCRAKTVHKDSTE